jgi:hypothetical protein
MAQPLETSFSVLSSQLLVGAFLVTRLSAVTATSGSVNEVATHANEDEQRTVPDEDPDNEVVDERNGTAEVTLPSTIRMSYFLSVFLLRYQLGFFS